MGKEEATRKLFGTDGIRGTANQYPMTAEVALSLGRTVTERLRLPGRRCRVVIGKDTRLGAGPLCGHRAQGPGHDRRHR